MSDTTDIPQGKGMLGYGIMKGHFMSRKALETSQKKLVNIIQYWMAVWMDENLKKKCSLKET